MEKNLVSIIRSQSTQLFKNTEYLFDYVDNRLLAEKICKWPLWRQLYHLLHSMDQWFINPYMYKDQREDGYNIAALSSDCNRPPLTKEELFEYYRMIKGKVGDYLGSLKEASLSEYPEGSKFTRLDLVLGQFRHIMFHIGMIHGCILMKNGEIPNYVGLAAPVKPIE